MTWLYPDDYAYDLLESNPAEILELAKLVSLSPRIEPLLLRNMRLKFLPGSEPELEYQLWFSTLITARSTQNIVLYHDVARLLADDLKATAQFSEVWSYTQECTAHWSDLDLLEQQIRFETLQKDNQPEIDKCLQKILRQLSKAQSEDERLNLARWAKNTLPLLSSTQPSNETAWLAQYSATALGAIANWTTLSSTEPMPDWLATALPSASENFEPSKIGIHLRYDDGADHLVLECSLANPSSQILEFPTPLPAKLYIQGDQQTTGSWEIINTDSRIKISPVSKRIELRTIDGKRYELLADFEFSPEPIHPAKTEIYLTYVNEDRELADKVAQQLADNHITVTLLVESPDNPYTSQVPAEEEKFLRLWTQAAQQQWQKTKLTEPLLSNNSMLLQWQQAELPKGALSTPVINLDEIQHSVNAIQQWLATEQNQASEPEPEDINALLKKLESTETKPRDRLAIGDLLAKLGDPRTGVGVKEYEIIEYIPEVQRLLDELNDINTQPPRRLEIGNMLAEMGDPRPGVGLDEKGLPEIDWVEIPAGDFIYGEDKSQKPLDLPKFKISRYPVTNSQFQAFVDAGGYQEKRWWQDLIKPEPKNPGFKQANRPRETVDWYEAVAYTRWLSAQLNVKVSLPTEQQWEKAARGQDGYVYPWGNEFHSGFANFNETASESGSYYLQETSAVGIYPQGESLYQLADMAGNVWEWCLNEYVEPDQIEVNRSTVSRVLRGGSWSSEQAYLRSASRFRLYPDDRYSSIGFRLAQD